MKALKAMLGLIFAGLLNAIVAMNTDILWLRIICVTMFCFNTIGIIWISYLSREDQ